MCRQKTVAASSFNMNYSSLRKSKTGIISLTLFFSKAKFLMPLLVFLKKYFGISYFLFDQLNKIAPTLYSSRRVLEKKLKFL